MFRKRSLGKKSRNFIQKMSITSVFTPKNDHIIPEHWNRFTFAIKFDGSERPI